jgi:hypothetical protein
MLKKFKTDKFKSIKIETNLENLILLTKNSLSKTAKKVFIPQFSKNSPKITKQILSRVLIVHIIKMQILFKLLFLVRISEAPKKILITSDKSTCRPYSCQSYAGLWKNTRAIGPTSRTRREMRVDNDNRL